MHVHLAKPVLEALQGHLNGLEEGYVFEGRDMGHISTRQIQWLLDGCSRQGLQVELVGEYLNPQFALFSDQVT